MSGTVIIKTTEWMSALEVIETQKQRIYIRYY
jgi:hypothetical protein